jgi:hypothetical protein
MANPKAEGLHTVKRWVRIPDGTKVRFREDGREGIFDGLTDRIGSRPWPQSGLPDCSTASTPEIPTCTCN